jgi:hypothetical protein
MQRRTKHDATSHPSRVTTAHPGSAPPSPQVAAIGRPDDAGDDALLSTLVLNGPLP